jgi:hypothetical protein
MKSWYYAKDGRQQGPVSTDEIVRLFATGSIAPTDLVWHEGMKDWREAAQVAELAPPPAAPRVEPPAMDPYRPPAVGWNEVEAPRRDREEIVPGSDPLDPGSIVARAWELTKRHFGLLIGAGGIYLAISIGYSFAVEIPLGVIESLAAESGAPPSAPLQVYQAATSIVGHVLDLFLSLGLARIGLNLIAGRPAEVGMLFGEGGKLVRAIGASVIYFAMVLVGLLLFVVPGIYLAIRFGQFKTAIVDQDLGILESLQYSSRLTEGNRLNLFWLALLSILIVLAGLLALVVGLLAALPLVYLADLLAYRWLQHGRRAMHD